MINVFMGSFCLTPNTVFPICKVKIVKTLCVGARANIGSARVDLCKQKKNILFGLFIYLQFDAKSLLIINFVILSEPVLKKS